MGKYWDLITHPSELRAAIQWSVWHDPLHERDPATETPNLKKCYDFLEQTSRSFSKVIQELQPELRVPVMLFYLILRGLDTVEDDMTIPIEKKDKMLREFHTYLDTPGWNFTESKEPYGTGITVDGPNEADRQLLVEFDVVIKEFGEINETYRVVIKDITKRMGNGMADYANNAAHNLYGVDTLADFDMYCYYVAGLVGEGLTRLFIASGKENPKLTEAHDLAYSMGLFLQKTNIIRDYREDLDDKRRFWPKEVWSKYAKDLADFADPKNMDAALNCISEMTLVSLGHVTDCLIYLSVLRDQSVFNFCAIPQVMAIATLALVYRNPLVFSRNIKMRRGEMAQLMLESTNLRGVCEIFLRYIRVIHKKSTPTDPNFLKISMSCGHIEQFIESIFPSATTPTVAQLKLAAEKQEREKQKMTPEERSDMVFVYVTVIGVWIVLFVIMTAIAYLCGARFDHMWEGAKRLWSEVREGGITAGSGAGVGRKVEGTPGRVEL